jgi:Tfp pilus assembly protein PilP
MRFTWLAVALTLVLAPATAFAGRAKSKPKAARKAETAKTRSARVTPGPQARECSRVILEDVPFRELRLVGIVSQGRTQKALMMDASDEPSTLMRGECVGVERVHYDDVVKPLLQQYAR